MPPQPPTVTVPSETDINYLKLLAPRARTIEQVGSRRMEHDIEGLANSGKKTVDLYGYPVVTPPGHIMQAAVEASSSIFSPPSAGLETLRQGIAEAMAAQLPGSFVNPETEILITSGAMHALHVAFT